jgi:hypothetical protein
VVTAVVVLAGLVGFMTANSAGALVATKNAADQSSDVSVPAPPADSAPGGKQPPASSSEAPPPEKPKAPAKPKPPPAPTFPAEAMYAGDATGSDLAIAVAVKGKQASAYLCDGAAVEDWLKGTADAGKMDLSSKNGESAITASLKGKRLAGTVTFQGNKLPFSIAFAPAPAGLYRGQNGKTTVGWIVLPNGKQVGMVNNDGMESPAPELDVDAGAAMVGGMTVMAKKVEGDTTWS